MTPQNPARAEAKAFIYTDCTLGEFLQLTQASDVLLIFKALLFIFWKQAGSGNRLSLQSKEGGTNGEGGEVLEKET